MTDSIDKDEMHPAPGRKPCCGAMFPQTLHVQTNKPIRGKAFEYELTSPGLARSERRVRVIEDAWNDCLNCADFDSCYKLGMGKLALEAAISEK
ncbi:MAG: hypothetical protein ACX94D_06975 [Henriciella sp.]